MKRLLCEANPDKDDFENSLSGIFCYSSSSVGADNLVSIQC